MADANPMGNVRTPIQVSFILTLPRSGSTLLRFLLDSHSEIACPPESQLASLCSNLLSSWLDYRDDSDFSARQRLGLRQARAASRRLIGWHLSKTHKTQFCDKSLPNVDLAGLLAAIFPRGKFICLYRHPMDFIASALDACRWGFKAYGLHSYAVSSVDNFVFGLGRAWCEKTAIMLGIEKQFPRRSCRVLYEDLVRTPDVVYEAVCGFLGVRYEGEAINNALRGPHLLGAGDHKIHTTDAVSTDSLGRGGSVPVGLLPPMGLQSMNQLCEAVGYPAITPTWNREPSSFRRGLLRAQAQSGVLDRLCAATRRRLSQVDSNAAGYGSTIRIIIEECDSPRGFTFNCRERQVAYDFRRDDDPDDPSASTVVARSDALLALLNGTASITRLTDGGDIRIGRSLGALSPSAVFRLVGHVLNDFGDSDQAGLVTVNPFAPILGSD
jgi:protein-tyrosine sulfotransferase